MKIITAPDVFDQATLTENYSTKLGKFIGDNVINIVDASDPYNIEPNGSEARHLGNKKKKKKFKKKVMKFIIPMLIIWVVIKSLVLPVVLKALAVLSGKAFLLSLMSLVLAAIMGLRRLVSAIGGIPGLPFSNLGPTAYSKYRRKEDEIIDEGPSYEGSEPYKYYRDCDPNKDKK
ncbi:hypothetical protein HCN44_003442 [Aphidius gifuensis]|uniref:Uncharacterized protein n=1 Tax=Aphidius gifuensis TaxID=684658 RepID=A0A834XLJ4_APHGI|nr:uncharacterized protein LOC122859856 [Aphidius gifuensis]KAF7987579.1 hypothetical protein HCN44_003442 [Aphidius gifuensis]